MRNEPEPVSQIVSEEEEASEEQRSEDEVADEEEDQDEQPQVVGDMSDSDDYPEPKPVPASSQSVLSEDYAPPTSPQTSRKRRRLPDIVPSKATPVEEPTPKRARTSKKTGGHLKPLAEDSEVLHAFRKRYCREHEITDFAFNDLIHANAHNKPHMHKFWEELNDAVPHHQGTGSRQNLQKRCRRLFHNFEKRGQWTEEEDDELRAAVARYGHSDWKAVSRTLERHHDDCRDRWRNNVSVNKRKAKQRWTPEESRRLAAVVGNCAAKLLTDRLSEKWNSQRKRDRPPENEKYSFDQEDLVDLKVPWGAISDAHPGRDRLSCRARWINMEKKDWSLEGVTRDGMLRLHGGVLTDQMEGQEEEEELEDDEEEEEEVEVPAVTGKRKRSSTEESEQEEEGSEVEDPEPPSNQARKKRKVEADVRESEEESEESGEEREPTEEVILPRKKTTTENLVMPEAKEANEEEEDMPRKKNTIDRLVLSEAEEASEEEEESELETSGEEEEVPRKKNKIHQLVLSEAEEASEEEEESELEESE